MKLRFFGLGKEKLNSSLLPFWGVPAELVLPCGLQADGNGHLPLAGSFPSLQPSPPLHLVLKLHLLRARSPPSMPDKRCANCPQTQPSVRPRKIRKKKIAHVGREAADWI